MSSNKRSGEQLYRELIGPLSGDSHTEEFDALTDTKGNRFMLAHVAQQGGERGRAARAKLSQWESSDDNGSDAA